MDGRKRFIDDDFFIMSEAENGICFSTCYCNLSGILY